MSIYLNQTLIMCVSSETYMAHKIALTDSKQEHETLKIFVS